MGEFGENTRKIKNIKLTIWECMKEIQRDEEMMKTAIEADNAMKEDFQNTAELIRVLVVYGLYSVDEGVAIERNIEEALRIIKGRNAEEVANRVADLSVRRIAEKVDGEVGGEVVEEEKE